MANNTGKKQTAKKTQTEVHDVDGIETAELSMNEAEVTAEVIEKPKYKVKVMLDPNMVIPVINGYQGKLIYNGKRSGEHIEWEYFGEEQDMTLQELKNVKGSDRMFFENNWFMIDDPEVIEYLGVEKYYKNALKHDEFDELFEKDAAEIREIISKLSKGQKKSVVYRAKQLIAEEKIDSMKTISTLEECLSVELIER